MLCGHLAPYSQTWPTSGSMRTGVLYPLLTRELRTDGRGSSSSRGPLLPTPETGQSPNGHGVRDGRSGNGHQSGNSLDNTVRDLLKTPTAQLAANGGSQHPDKRRQGGHGPTLADQVEHLLPTPQAHDAVKGKTPEQIAAMRARSGAGVRNLNEVAETLLLPTPTAMDSHGARNATANRSTVKPATNHAGWTLSDVFWTGDGTGPRSSAGRPSSDDLRQGQLSPDEPENG